MTMHLHIHLYMYMGSGGGLVLNFYMAPVLTGTAIVALVGSHSHSQLSAVLLFCLHRIVDGKGMHRWLMMLGSPQWKT